MRCSATCTVPDAGSSSSDPPPKQPQVRALAPLDLCRHDLLRHDDMPSWFQRLHGPAIQIGYRPTTRSASFYLSTLVSLHNETMNIWSHVLGVVAFVVLLIFGDRADDLYMITYRLASAATFLASAAYHTLLPINERVYARLQRLDYAAIFILIGASAIPYYSIEYACSATLELAAVVTTAAMMLVLAFLVGTQDWFARDTPRGRLVRVAAFSAFALTCVVFGGLAVLTGFSPKPYIEADPAIGVGLRLVSALYVAGPVAYAFAWPERLGPGAFTDLFGASHQIMHVCVLGGALVNGWCMERALNLRDVVTSCES